MLQILHKMLTAVIMFDRILPVKSDREAATNVSVSNSQRHQCKL